MRGSLSGADSGGIRWPRLTPSLLFLPSYLDVNTILETQIASVRSHASDCEAALLLRGPKDAFCQTGLGVESGLRHSDVQGKRLD